LLNETGVKVCSITFDGASVNTKMCTELGVNFDIDHPQAYIVDDREEKVYAFYDPAHMLKLIRNARNNKTIILNSKGEEINWRYIELYQIEQNIKTNYIFYLPSFTINSNNCNSLISIKNRGGLIFPSNNVVKVCQETERIIRSHPVTYFNNVKNKLYLFTKVKTNLYKRNTNLFSSALNKNHFWIHTRIN